MAALASPASAAASARSPIGILLPTNGIDGARGIRMRDAVLVAAEDLHLRLAPVAGAKPVQNPHQDEGSDNGGDVAAVPGAIRAAAREGIRILIGPLRSNVALAATPALHRWDVVAISGTARAPSARGSSVFKLSPSEAQLAAFAARWMRRRLGRRACVLDDGTRAAQRVTDAFLAAEPAARRFRLGPDTPAAAVDRCLAGADGVYAAGLSAGPIICSAQTARRADPVRLVTAMSLRDFDPAEFAPAGALYHPQAAPITRTAAIVRIARRYHARAFTAADEDALRYYAALQVAAQAQRIAARTHQDLPRVLGAMTFSTAIGPVRFDAQGDPAHPHIVMTRLD